MENGSSLVWINSNHKKNTRIGKIAGGRHGGRKDQNYFSVRFNGKEIKAHHVVWYLHYNEWPKQIDHINGNSQDNRIENLRTCTNSQNQCNKKTYKNNLSGIKGLHFIKRLNKWAVVIHKNKKQHWIGTFEDKELAELVSIESRKKYHGEFARHC